MKRKIKRWACSNCGKPLRNIFVQICPRCNGRFSDRKINFKHFVLMAPVGLLVFYALFYFAFTNIEDFSFRGADTLEEFNTGMIFVLIITLSILLFLYFIQRKNEKKSEEYTGMPISAKKEIKEFEIENDNKLIALLIISFIIIFPVILIPAYLAIREDLDLFSNPLLAAFFMIISIFVFALPFIVGYYTFEKPMKKLYKEES